MRNIGYEKPNEIDMPLRVVVAFCELIFAYLCGSPRTLQQNI